MTSFHSFSVPDNSTSMESPYDAILGVVKYYVLLGFVSIVCHWVAWASWITAAERQVRCIRYAIIRVYGERSFYGCIFRYALFRNILRQEIGWFDTQNSGELSSRLIGDLGKSRCDASNTALPFFFS